MIDIGTYDELVAEPRIDIVAMAEIVHDLIAGGLFRVQDGKWLREHSEATALGRHAYEALHALGERLSESGTAALDGTTSKYWL